MIAMQYSFTLPSDYDMGIIDRRIREKGPLLDGFPDLHFKAYLSARRGEFGTRENLYAPFYVWRKPEGASRFLCGPGFEAVTQSFGRPEVKTWIVWQAKVSDNLAQARFATREIPGIRSSSPLAAIRREEGDAAEADIGRGALACVCGFEPTGWTRVRFRLWQKQPDGREDMQVYRLGHLSRGDHAQAPSP